MCLAIHNVTFANDVPLLYFCTLLVDAEMLKYRLHHRNSRTDVFAQASNNPIGSGLARVNRLMISATEVPVAKDNPAARTSMAIQERSCCLSE